MRKLINIFTLFAIWATSCTLDEPVYDRYLVDDFYQTEAECNAALLGIYSYLYDYNYYKTEYFYLLAGMEDVFCTSEASTVLGVSSNKHLSAASTEVSDSWESMYQIINQSNLLLSKIDASTFSDESDRDRYKGEAYFMRGWTYFNLVRTFGGVPIRVEPTVDNENFAAPRASVDEVYEQIFADLELASSLMPYRAEQPADELGRANRGAAESMLALANLTYANYLDLNSVSGSEEYYSEAITYCNRVINYGGYSLIEDYATLWDVALEQQHSSEVIFAIHFMRDASTTTFTASCGSEFASRMLPLDAVGLNYEKGTRDAFGLHPLFYDVYTSGDYANDYRFESSFLLSWTNTDGSTIPFNPTQTLSTGELHTLFISKYTDPYGLNIRTHENNLNLIRLSEIYLIKAEAANEIDDQTTAVAAFNKVRERARWADDPSNPRTAPVDLDVAFLRNYSDEPDDKSRFREVIFKERGLEFVGEMSRFFDLARMRRANGMTYCQYMHTDYIPNYGDVIWYQTGSRYSPYITSRNIETWSEKYLLAPIPQSELEQNGALDYLLDQNYGW